MTDNDAAAARAATRPGDDPAMPATVAQPIEWLPYRPSNGTEGAVFFDSWCSRCARDLPLSTGKDYDACGPGETCDLIANSMAYPVTDPRYPKEWRRRADATEYPGAECTAFLPLPDPGSESPSVAVRDDLTKDLFA